MRVELPGGYYTTTGGGIPYAGQRLLVNHGRLEEVELVEPYGGTTLWRARVLRTGEMTLVETAMP